MLQQLQGLLMTMRLWDVLDILVVAFFLYRIYLLIRNTRATALVKGLLLLGALTLVTGWLRLHALSWILDKLMAVLIVALPIVFQPELRRALEQIGRGKFIRPSAAVEETDRGEVIDAVCDVAADFARRHVGALIVFERATGLDDYIDTGIRIDGVVSREILGNIFIVNTSEETGTISYAYDGHIYRHMDEESLRNRLRSFLLLDERRGGTVSGMIRKWRGGKENE